MNLDALRLIVRPDPSGILGHGICWDSSLLVPLHVLDGASCGIERRILLYQSSGHAQVVNTPILVQQFPAADAALFTFRRDIPTPCPLRFKEPVHEGEQVTIQWLKRLNNEISVQEITSNIREVVTIGRYEYRSAGGANVRIRNISAIFLNGTVPTGTSGAPVYYARSNLIVGFIHGNGHLKDSFALCLDPRPLRNNLAHATRLY